jgi:rare lipoprotein A
MGRRSVPLGIVQVARMGAAAGIALTLANCGQSNVDPKYGVAASRRVVEANEPVPKGGGTYRVGKPYQVAGRTYVPEENTNYDAEGIASWYGDVFHGRLTANGEVFDMNSISAAHPTLPIPSYVRVTYLRNKRSIIVRVNDRGPFHENRVIDVSVRAAKLLGFHQYGVARVRVEYVGRAALEGSDDEKLAATLRHGTPAPGFETKLAAAAPPAPSASPAKPSRPFLAEFFDPKPTVRAEAEPPPEQRAAEPPVRAARRAPAATPETVGRAPARPSYTVASERSQPVPPPAPRVATADAPTTFDARFAPAPAAPARSEPVSAFAPRFDGVMTGRGIY